MAMKPTWPRARGSSRKWVSRVHSGSIVLASVTAPVQYFPAELFPTRNHESIQDKGDHTIGPLEDGQYAPRL